MTSQQSPAEIFEKLEKTIHGYILALAGYTDEQFAYKSAEDVWSLGQMYEHLFLSANFFFFANTLRCLEQRKGQMGGEKNQYGDNLFIYNRFPPIKVKIPEAVRGPEPVAKTREEYRPLFEKIIVDAQKLIEPVTQDAGEYKYNHPVFGWLNAHEWFHNLEMHHRHHLRQQKELESLMLV